VGSAQPPIKSVLGALPEVESPEREADYSPPSSAEVKKAWSFTVMLSRNVGFYKDRKLLYLLHGAESFLRS
jgi:hypothetical protein